MPYGQLFSCLIGVVLEKKNIKFWLSGEISLEMINLLS